MLYSTIYFSTAIFHWLQSFDWMEPIKFIKRLNWPQAAPIFSENCYKFYVLLILSSGFLHCYDDIACKRFPHYWPFLRESTGHRWIPLTNDQLCSQIAKFMGPILGPPGSCRPQMSPMLDPRTLLSGLLHSWVYLISWTYVPEPRPSLWVLMLITASNTCVSFTRFFRYSFSKNTHLSSWVHRNYFECNNKHPNWYTRCYREACSTFIWHGSENKEGRWNLRMNN